MQQFVPQYYKKFNCIAEKCNHNCCIGWEIDIDKNTYNYYKSIEGEFGKRLKSSIAETNCPHFINANNGRCPHLNHNNLCDIIINLGEDALCDICRLHPRFVNVFESRRELGLGLCCEEAARIILTSKEKFQLVADGVEENAITLNEQSFFRLRNKILDALQDRTKDIDKRIILALSFVGESYKEFSAKDYYDVLFPLERLDKAFELCLNNLLNTETYELPKGFDIMAEQLLCYFVFRHLSGAIEDGRFTGRLKFAINSYNAIRQILLHTNGVNINTVIDTARMYSSEVEYSDKNLECLLHQFEVLN